MIEPGDEPIASSSEELVYVDEHVARGTWHVHGDRQLDSLAVAVGLALEDARPPQEEQ